MYSREEECERSLGCLSPAKRIRLRLKHPKLNSRHRLNPLNSPLGVSDIEYRENNSPVLFRHSTLVLHLHLHLFLIADQTRHSQQSWVLTLFDGVSSLLVVSRLLSQRYHLVLLFYHFPFSRSYPVFLFGISDLTIADFHSLSSGPPR